MTDETATVLVEQQDKENIEISKDRGLEKQASSKATLAKDQGEQVQVMADDDEVMKENTVPAPKPAQSRDAGSDTESGVELEETMEDDKTLADPEPISERQSELSPSAVASPQVDSLTAFPSAPKDLETEVLTMESEDKAASSENDDEDDAVLVSTSDLVGHDPSLDTPSSQLSSRRSQHGGNKTVESFTKRLSFKGVSEGLRRSGSRLSDKTGTPGSERGSMDAQDKRSSLDRVPEKGTDESVKAVTADEATFRTSAHAGESDSKQASGTSTPTAAASTAGTTVRPAFRARVSASAEGVKRAVLGSRKDSAGSVKKVEGKLVSGVAAFYVESRLN